MNKKGNKRQSFATCLLWGMLFGTVLGVAMDKLAVGIALGNMFGMMYYLFFANSDKNSNDDNKENWHYKIFCVNGNTGFRNESRIFYFIHLQNEEDYERKKSSST